MSIGPRWVHFYFFLVSDLYKAFRKVILNIWQLSCNFIYLCTVILDLLLENTQIWIQHKPSSAANNDFSEYLNLKVFPLHCSMTFLLVLEVAARQLMVASSLTSQMKMIMHQLSSDPCMKLKSRKRMTGTCQGRFWRYNSYIWKHSRTIETNIICLESVRLNSRINKNQSGYLSLTLIFDTITTSLYANSKNVIL